MAESSVTIEDIVFVIDSGLMKEKHYSLGLSFTTPGGRPLDNGKPQHKKNMGVMGRLMILNGSISPLSKFHP